MDDMTKSYYQHRYNTTDYLPDNIDEDLNLDDIFKCINYTSSRTGEQYLYDLIHRDKISEVGSHEGIIAQLSTDHARRTNLIKTLKKLSHPDAYTIPVLFSKKISPAPAWESRAITWFRFMPFLFTGLFIIVQSLYLLIPLILFLIANLVLHYRNKVKIQEYFFSVPQLIKMLQQAEILAQDPDYIQTNKSISQTLVKLKHLKKSLGSFRLSIKLESDMAIVAYLVAELWNIFFLTEAYAINKGINLLNGKQSQLEEVFRFVGLLDILCSISLYRETLPFYCLPSPLQKPDERIIADNIYHPLIENAVTNNFAIREKSIIITGSNMSGKTSFIRTIGINLLSSRALNTSFAKNFQIDINMRLASSIHISDSLMDGESYFLREVECMKELLEQSKNGNYLFLIDEPFRGTNTVERLAIGKAVLSVLAENNIVIVSTHDLELIDLLKEKYTPYYFCENVRNGLLEFDYKIKSGKSTETNAIKILEIYEYPESILIDAREQANRMMQNQIN